jgi:hypothetical protein
LDGLLREKDKQMVELKNNYEKSTKDVNTVMIALEKDLHTAKSDRA